MMNSLGVILVYAIALVAGVLAGFFIVFNSVFSDVTSAGERIFSFVLVVIVYAVLGLIFGYLAGSWAVSLPLAIPAVLLVLWYTFREPGTLLLNFVYIVVTLAAACLGSYGGATLRTRGRALSR
jgi:hypothetical protein